ncbi:hypothetical protein [Staphylococcus epidermidis]|uniref:hypothetical protein n=1 Tax=Staphylococcus epidermidis TaxID=1282 RepID=UPI001879AC76|nr:hypothetical protein [Staphylococcus epidermidis]MBE7319158.1 hypothetical protein [Staphylococcus epidermidis]
MVNVIDELVEWSVYILTHKKGELSKLNQLDKLRIIALNQFVVVSTKKVKIEPLRKDVYQLTLFDFI